MSSTNRSSRSCSLPRQHQSRSDTTSETIRQRSKTRSVGRPTKSSVSQKIVGPTKSHITKAINQSERLILTSRECLKYLSDVTALTADQDELQEADKLLLDLKDASYQLKGLDTFVASKFNNPLIRNSTDREKHFQEVQKLLQGGEIPKKLVELDLNSRILEQRLTELGVTISEFVPSSHADNGGLHQDINTEESASDPSLGNDPLVELPEQGTLNSPLSFQEELRRVAAPRLFDPAVPKNPSRQATPMPSAVHATQPQGLSDADRILRLQQELENIKQKSKVDALREDNLRAQLLLQFEQKEKLRKQLKQATELNEDRGTQAMGNTTSAQSSQSTLNDEATPQNPNPRSNTPQVSTTDRILWEMNKNLNANNLLQQKVLEAINSQQRGATSARVNVDDDYIRDYEEQLNAEEPDGLPEQPSSPLPNNRSFNSSVPSPAAPNSGMKLESMMKIMTPYDGTGNLAIFKRNFEMLTAAPSLTSTQRNMILLSNLKGEARKCYVEKEDSAEAITLTFEMLTAVFGKNTNKRHIEEKLVNLKFNQTDPREMRIDLATHQVVFHQLRDQGVSEYDERPIEILAAKLPAEMRRNLSLFITRQGERVSQAAVVAELNVLIESLAMDNTLLRQANSVAANEISQTHLSVNLAKTSHSKHNNNVRAPNREKPLAYDAVSSPKEFFDPISKTTLAGYYAPGTKGVNLKIFHRTFPFEDSEDSKCLVCSGKHHSMRCTLTSAEFRRIVTAKNLCPVCTRSHTIEQCRASYRCGYCDGVHHMGGCPKKEFYRDMANYPAGAQERETALSEQAGSLAGTESNIPDSVSQADLPTVPVIPNPSIPARISPVPKTVHPTIDIKKFSKLKLSKKLKISKSYSSSSYEFSNTEIAQYTEFVTRTVPPHFIAMLTDDKDRGYALTFMCLKMTNGHNLLALVDTGASMSLICHEAALKLDIPVKGRTRLTITGFHDSGSEYANIYGLSLQTSDRNNPLSFLIVGTQKMPTLTFAAPTFSPEDKQFIFDTDIDIGTVLLSKCFAKNKVKINMILGNDLLAWISSHNSYQKHVLPSGRSLEETILGCIVHPVPSLLVYRRGFEPLVTDPIIGSDCEMLVNYASVLLDSQEPENEMTKLTLEIAQMWRTENLGIESVSVQEDSKKSTMDLLAAFNQSVRFNSDGALEVALPYNGNQGRLASNKAVATRRLHNLLETLKRGKDLLTKYDKIIQDQLLAGYIEKVTDKMVKKNPLTYFIPHRVVTKLDSNTTKLRVVLDASSHAVGQLSLNDCVYAGTNMITPLFGILLRARCTKYIIVADIEKAFHQVRLQEEFRNVVSFMWIKDITKDPLGDNVVVYRFTRIPFGVACSPFLLAAYIMYFLDNNPHPLNAVIKENIYVDNCMFGTNDSSKIRSLIKDSKAIFTRMDMNLREYVVNHAESMSKLDAKDATATDIVKLLGYKWNPKDDTFSISVAQLDIDHPTKRDVASKQAETFDPLGLASPITVPFKRLTQKLWSHNVDWKQRIPRELLSEWKALRSNFADQVITVPRQLTEDYSDCHMELLVFSDASQDIYACAVYAYFIRKGEKPTCRLLASKNKIKPSKQERWTIPKLELLAIECGSTLATTIMAELRVTVTQIRLFTDSSCALYWILSKHRKRPWVANRIDAIDFNQRQMSECGIQTTIHHCPTDLNPADLATRGMSTTELQNSSFWFNGPEFLKETQEEWPCKIEGTVACPAEFQKLVYAEIIDPVTQKKKKPLVPKAKAPAQSATIMVASTESGPHQSIVPFDVTNSISKLIQIVWFLFKTYTKVLKKKQWTSYVMKMFASAKSRLQEERIVRSFIIQQHYEDAKFRKLPPFSGLKMKLHSDGLYRLIRCIKSPVLPQEAHEPILINHKHPLAAMIIRETHLINGHLPTQYTRCTLRTKYWIPKDGTVVAIIVDQCVRCKRANANPLEYPYSEVLPDCRTTPSKPFSKVGLDYLGPLVYRKDDGIALGKAYVLVYSCLNTRGAMLRLVPDSTSEKYIMSLKMIFGEVGVPEEIYSDNASTFKLGAAVINSDIQELEYSQSLTSFLAARSINYSYITPLAPWQGGIYERVVGLVKRQIYKECGRQIFDFFTLQYVVSGAQRMVNNRPLTPHARNPDDMVVLRPIDFINPGVMIEVPAGSSASGPKGYTADQLKAHLGKLEETLERMWKIWSTGYLLNLRDVHYKSKKCSTLEPRVGQVVIIETRLIPRHKWPLGVIVELNVSERDQKIRSAVVRCKGKLYTRSVSQLIPLEVESLNHQDAEEEKVTNPEGQPIYTPSLPSAAVLDTPDIQYAPELFPKDVLENLQEPTQLPALDLETFKENIKNHPTIGSEGSPEDQVDLDLLDEKDSQYQDPNTVVPDIARDHAAERLPDGRTRDYLPRKAKASATSYVTFAEVQCQYSFTRFWCM